LLVLDRGSLLAVAQPGVVVKAVYEWLLTAPGTG
jgi:hypothetical protein